MSIDYSPEALANMDEPWVRNAAQFGRVHANSYIEFLRKRTDRLSTDYKSGKPVPTNAKLRYRVIQKKKKCHGHIVVFEVNVDAVRVLRYFHTAQDWQSRQK